MSFFGSWMLPCHAWSLKMWKPARDLEMLLPALSTRQLRLWRLRAVNRRRPEGGGKGALGPARVLLPRRWRRVCRRYFLFSLSCLQCQLTFMTLVAILVPSACCGPSGQVQGPLLVQVVLALGSAYAKIAIGISETALGTATIYEYNVSAEGGAMR